MTTVLPNEVTYGTITGSLMLAVGDSGDPDTLPDRWPLPPGSKITFTPSVPRVLFAGPGKVIIPRPIVVPTPADTETFTGAFTVDLVATDNPAGTPIDWHYNVTVEIPDVPTWTFPVMVPTGSVQDLTAVMPVDHDGPIPIIKGPPGDAGPQGDPGPPVAMTDWINVTSDLGPAYISGSGRQLWVRRVGNVVHLAGSSVTNWQLQLDRGLGARLWTAPAGFQPSAAHKAVLGHTDGVPGVSVFTSVNGQLWVNGTGTWYPGGSYITDDPFPT